MKKFLFLTLTVIGITQTFAQTDGVWQIISNDQSITPEKIRETPYSENQKLIAFDAVQFKRSLGRVTDVKSGQPGVEIQFPNVSGELESFLVWESSNFEPELQARNPDIRAYVGKGITDSTARLNFSFSPLGIQTMVFRGDSGSEFIEPYTVDRSVYVLFDSATRIRGKLPFNCATPDLGADDGDLLNSAKITAKSSAGNYKTLRLALSCTGEYGAYFGGVSGALAAMNATMTRVNGIMENDLAVKLIMIDNKSIIYTNASTDPYSTVVGGKAPDAWSTELQSTLTSLVGNGNYDLGHLFGASGGGGNAGCIGCVCVDTGTETKGMAFTSPSDNIPQGDDFDVDFVTHEMGHQLGAYHTFTHLYEGRTSQVEPGSGSTIMGYAGVVDIQNGVDVNVQDHSDAYFTFQSVDQIQKNLATKSCPVTVTLANKTPVVNAGLDYTIPKGTPFMLVGTASDQDSDDVLTYCWEENDQGTSTTVADKSIVSNNKTAGPNFRSFIPSASNVRYMPGMAKILVNSLYSSKGWESLYNPTIAPVTSRNFNFSFTARDNRVGGGQTASDLMKVSVDINKGPFTVTSQSGSGITTYPGGSTQTVTWNVAGTQAITGASKVDILLSTDVNGDSTTFSPLATGLTNNGTATVVLPGTNITSTTCRFMVKASGNIFFAVNSKNFTITANLAVEDFGFQNFVLSPNPNKGNFTVQFDNPIGDEIKVDVFDIRGRKIFENSYAGQAMFNEDIQLNNAGPGVYLVSVSDGSNRTVKKIVVE